MAESIPDNLARRLDEMDGQFEAIAAQLMDPEILTDHNQVRALSIKRAALEGPVMRWREVKRIDAESLELQEAIESGDEELAALAREELPELGKRREALAESVRTELVTAEDKAVGAMILELRAGVGGDEAAIWAGDLLEMYQRHAANRNWSFEILDLQAGEMGGVKTAIIDLSGEGAWSELGYEGGTHQVKRVPATEAQGRVHTSTATVAVLPQPEEVALELDKSDVKESITTAQGPGGQNVNKVATAVHLIHEPTGTEVRMQETKSQAQNREKAWRLLRARLYEKQQKAIDEKRARERASMIGSGGRAEKIRTYRYKDNLVVDHRLGQSFNLGELMQGRLTPLIEALIELDVANRLAAL
jgi:peptide chain release factor 1